MKKVILLLLLITGLSFAKSVFAKKIPVLKSNNLEFELNKKIHPLEKYFSKPSRPSKGLRVGNKLLILLIEFQEDNDPETTGNGKFVLDADDYPFSIGKPPHDHAYFQDLAEALRQYYLAASYESFDLDIDIFPQPDSTDFTAYTLPNKMSYYNPGTSDYDLMVERFEEYFQDAFSVADLDTNINFSEYDHFMFIHAGSDWQHDTLGDSPHDIPSFYINVGDHATIEVDNGLTMNRACNVPELITQDTEVDSTGNIPVYDNYGVINGVMFHEFGHSLGFVDLYNTLNNSPQVGYYDIMDSGGSILLGLGFDLDGDNSADLTANFEGTFPAFPGAWSRSIPFEESFRQRGILKDISEFDPNRKINILPIATEYNEALMNDSTAYFVKIPINQSEYIILENRQTDPDGDGGSYLWSNSEGTVILHPTYPAPNPDNSNNYEYDFLLPGWIDQDFRNYGGGLLIWHIDEKILAENNNYENNTINVYHAHRAVKIIEADNIDDIGNPYSMFWKGTAYEPFYKYRPIIDSEGYFTGWDDETLVNANGQVEFIGEIFNDELSATSSPALMTNNDEPSMFSIYDISSYSIEPNVQRSMSFKFGTNLFDKTDKIVEADSITALGSIGSLYGFPSFPMLSNENVNFFSHIGNIWQDNFGVNIPLQNISSNSILPVDTNSDDNDEFLFIADNSITSITPEHQESYSYSSEIFDTPMYIEDKDILVVSCTEKLYVGESELSISESRLAYNGSIIATSSDRVYFIDPLAPSLQNYVQIPDLTSQNIPICYEDNDPEKNAVFIQNSLGDIFKIQNMEAEKLFSLYPYTSKKPTQLALGELDNSSQVYLVFGASDKIFALSLGGTLREGFPAYLENRSIIPNRFPRIIKFNENPMILIEELNGGFLAIDNEANFRIANSFYWCKNEIQDQFYWDDIDQKLFYIYSDNSFNLYSSYIENVNEDPIIWNGYRNRSYSLYEGEIDYDTSISAKLDAYAFPNPAKNGEIRIRINNASNKIELKIFDIAGNMLLNTNILKEANNIQDFRWNTKNIASGVYFAIIKSGNEKKKITFAIVN